MKRSDSLPDRLREACEARGLTRAALALALDVDRSTVDHWFLGDRTPSAATVERIAIVLGVEPGALLFGEVRS